MLLRLCPGELGNGRLSACLLREFFASVEQLPDALEYPTILRWK